MIAQIPAREARRKFLWVFYHIWVCHADPGFEVHCAAMCHADSGFQVPFVGVCHADSGPKSVMGGSRTVGGKVGGFTHHLAFKKERDAHPPHPHKGRGFRAHNISGSPAWGLVGGGDTPPPTWHW